jgi:hypothetical protein
MAIIAVPAGSLTFTGTTVVLARAIYPAVGSLAFTGPTIVLAKTIFPAAGTLTFTGTTTIGARTIFPATGSLAWSGTTVVLARKIFPAVGSMTVSGTTSLIPKRAYPAAGSLALSGLAPSINRYTFVTGSVYDAATGAKRTLGRFYIKPNNFLRNGGNLIVPKTITYDIPGSGNISIPLAPSKDGVTYTVEFDPTPADTTIPFRLKSGYFTDQWLVPTGDSADIATL